MATRQLITLIGDSKAVGQGNYASLTDFRFDITDADVQITRVIGGVDDGAPVTMTMGANEISIEHALGHGTKAAGLTTLPWIHKHAFSSTELGLNWRSYVNTGLYVAYVQAVWDKMVTAFPGDTIEYVAACMIVGVNDIPDASADIEYELRTYIENHRAEFGPVPFFIGMPGSDITKVGATAGEIAVARAAYTTVAAEFPRVYIIDETGVALGDGVHPTLDGSMDLGGDRFLPAMVTDGLGTNSLSSLTATARTFDTLIDAQTFADAAQTEHGNRDENPANGGFGFRYPTASGAWPVTPRSQAVEKHPWQNKWAVPIDGVMAAGPLDVTTDARPVDLHWYGAA